MSDDDSLASRRSANGDRPNPDPTVLTTQALDRESGHLRELVSQRLNAVDRQRETFVASHGQEMDLLNRERSEQFLALRELLMQRIDALDTLVDTRFNLLELQRSEQKSDTKAAVDAALSAAKEAVKEQTTASALSIAKSETATTKQLEQQQATTTTAVEALRRADDELKERIQDVDRNARDAIAGVAAIANGSDQRRLGGREDRTSLYATLGIIVSMLLVAVAILGVILTRTRI